MLKRLTTDLMQRSSGTARIALGMRGNAVRLTDLAQSGSAKVIMPHVGKDLPEAVFLNTSGGLTGGDSLHYDMTLGAGVRAVATTQTAERAYRAGDGTAHVDVTAQVGDGGWLDWLPQETILFDGAALARKTVVHLGRDAGCLLVESVILGRAAMGETVKTLALTDRREIWREGKLLMMEPLRLDTAALSAGDAVLGTARAFASVVMIGGDDLLTATRASLTAQGVTAAASGFDGRLVVRMFAQDGWPLRQQIARTLGVLRRGCPLPRVWQDFGDVA